MVEYKKIKKIENYGYIVMRKVIKSDWHYDGTLFEYGAVQYNILNNDNKLICDEWFDTYDLELSGRCIIGYRRNYTELQALLKYYSYPKNEDVVMNEYRYRYGALNQKGQFTVPAIYDLLTFNNENSYTAYHNGKLGCVDSELGNHIIPVVFDYIDPFDEEGKAYTEYEANGLKRFGYVDRNTKFDILDWIENSEIISNENIDQIDTRYSKKLKR